MTTKLTRKLIDELVPGDKPRTIWDSQVSGFGVRVNPSGKRSFLFRYRDRDGRQRSARLGIYPSMGLRTARSKAQEMRTLVLRREDPLAPSQRGGLTLAEVCKRFLAKHSARLKESTQTSHRRRIEKFIVPSLGDKKVQSITKRDVRELHTSHHATPVQANHVVTLLSTIFNFAIREEIYSGTNPCKGISRFPEKPKHYHLSDDEIRNLFEALDKYQGVYPAVVDIIKVALFSGMRKGEVRNLKWTECDLENGFLHLKDSKTGPKSIPVNSVVVDILNKQISLAGNPYVFPSPKKPGAPYSNVDATWRKIRDEAGVEGFRFHDLRHALAENAARTGMSLVQIGALLGHQRAETTRRYAVLASSAIRDLSEIVAASLLDKTNKK